MWKQQERKKEGRKEEQKKEMKLNTKVTGPCRETEEL
jgi:hypothetical protein